MESFHQKVINQIRPFLTNNLDVSDVIDEVKFLSPRERDEIKNRLRHDSQQYACSHFLDILHRHSVGSFVEFYRSVKKYRPHVAPHILSEVPPWERYRFQDSQNGACGDGPAYSNPRTTTLNRPPQADKQDLTERFKDMRVNFVEDNTRVDTSLEDLPQHLWDRIETIVRSEYGFEQLFHNLPRRQFIKTKDFTSHDEFSQLIDMLEREGWTINRFIDELVMKIDDRSVKVKILDILKDYHNYDEVMDVNTNQPVACRDDPDNLYAAKNADIDAMNIRREPSQQQMLVLSQTECDQTNIPSSYEGESRDFMAMNIQPGLSDAFGNVQRNEEGTENTIPKTIDDRRGITNIRETSPPTRPSHRPGDQYASLSEVTTPYHQTSQWGMYDSYHSQEGSETPNQQHIETPSRQDAGSFDNQENPSLQATGNINVPDPENPNVQDPENPNLQDAENPNVQDARKSNVQDAENPNLQDAGNPNLQDAENSNVQDAENPNLQDAGNPNLQDAGKSNVQDAENPNLQDAGNSYLQDAGKCNVQDAENPNVQDADNPNLQDAGNSKLQYAEILNLQDTENPNLQDAENLNLQDAEILNLQDAENLNLQDAENLNLQDAENLNLQDTENPNLQDAENLNLQDAENPNLQDAGNSNLQYAENPKSTGRWKSS